MLGARLRSILAHLTILTSLNRLFNPWPSRGQSASQLVGSLHAMHAFDSPFERPDPPIYCSSAFQASYVDPFSSIRSSNYAARRRSKKDRRRRTSNELFPILRDTRNENERREEGGTRGFLRGFCLLATITAFEREREASFTGSLCRCGCRCSW